MTARRGPNLRRRRLAAELRRLRVEAGITLEDAARHLDLAHSSLSRVETGHATARLPYVDSLLRLYRVPEGDREPLLQLAREARQRGWWTAYGDSLSNDYSAYIDFETEALSIRNYEPQTVPGLLQTESYARALIRGQSPDLSADETERQVTVRAARQERITGDEPARLWAIIGEPVLHYQVGGRGVLGEQLQHLLDMSEPPHIQIQVLPFTAGAHPGMASAFVILGFEGFPDVVHLENLTRGLYLEEGDEVRLYAETYEHLRAVALSPGDSRALLTKRLKEVHRSEL